MKVFFTILITATLLFNVSPLSAGEKIAIAGSTTVGPIAKAFAEYYMKQNPGVKFKHFSSWIPGRPR